MEMEFFRALMFLATESQAMSLCFFFLMLWLAKMLIHSLILQHD